MITSSTNPQIKQLAKLQRSAKFRREKGLFVAEGKKLLLEAKKYGKIEKVYAAESFAEDKGNLSLISGIEMETLGEKLYGELADTVTPQGVLALVSMPEYSPDELLKGKAVLILEDLRDPGNLGTIMRTAEGAGMDAVFLSRESVDLFNPKVVRASMGSIFRQPFYYSGDIYAMVKHMQEAGYRIYGTAMDGARLYSDADYTGKIGIVIGNEANGMSEKMSKLVDECVRIPMAGQLESLNAAVAAALLMYQRLV